VEDVENIDPTVNSVLNKEIFRQGGRIMITLGAKEVDFSPSFVIFMSTRDPSAFFTPDLCSRVTFVNFTVTPSSLSSQCLSKVLKAERPDIDAKRTELMKLQGEFRVRLRKLEDGLLNSLTSAKGNLLDNDKVIAELEHLKKEAGEIHAKMKESDDVMEEIEKVSSEYKPFATICSSIYFTLELLGQSSFLYQFSLSFFLMNVDKVFNEPSQELAKLKEPKERFRQLCKDFFSLSFSTVARGLMNKDQLAYAMRLAQIALDELAGLVFSGVRLDAFEMEFLLKGTSKTHKEPGQYAGSFDLNAQQKLELSSVLSFPSFDRLDSNLSENTAEWKTWLNSLDAEIKDDGGDDDEEKKQTIKDICPTGWEKTPIASMKMWNQLLVVKALRPDLVPNGCRNFVSIVFGDDFFDNTSTKLGAFVRKSEARAIEPYLFVSLPGYDASSKVVDYAQENKAKLQSFAMGSPEGYALADKAIDECAKSGNGWVLLKNVHLSPGWLSELEKRLHRKTGNPKFKLFLTMELNPKVPANLFRMSTVVIFEPPVGLKSALVRTFGSFDPKRVDAKPVERSRLYFLLAWLHSVILERLRYQPVGWTKGFEFGEVDLRCGINALDEWVNKVATGRNNVKIEKIPWDALQALFEKVLYGGRIDNRFDQDRLQAFVQSLWQPESFDDNFPLATAWDDKAKKLNTALAIPDGRKYADFKKFVDDMPAFNSPELIGLPSNADIMLSTRAGEQVLRTLLNIEMETGEGELDIGDGDAESMDDSGSAQPEWMTNLASAIVGWISKLPAGDAMRPLPKGKQAEELILDPLYRSMQREYRTFQNLLEQVIKNTNNVKDGLEGDIDVTKGIRANMEVFRTEGIPEHWRKYGGPRVLGKKTSLWIPDFTKRVKLLASLEKKKPSQYGDVDLWLGGLINPEAFVAASRQAIARYHSWSLDDIVLKVTVDDKSKRTDCYTMIDLRLFGAGWNGKLCINDATSFQMPPVRFTWILRKEAKKDKKLYVTVPCYLDDTRSKFLFSIDLERPKDVPINVWYQRGVAISVWS